MYLIQLINSKRSRGGFPVAIKVDGRVHEMSINAEPYEDYYRVVNGKYEILSVLPSLKEKKVYFLEGNTLRQSTDGIIWDNVVVPNIKIKQGIISHNSHTSLGAGLFYDSDGDICWATCSSSRELIGFYKIDVEGNVTVSAEADPLVVHVPSNFIDVPFGFTTELSGSIHRKNDPKLNNRRRKLVKWNGKSWEIYREFEYDVICYEYYSDCMVAVEVARRKDGYIVRATEIPLSKDKNIEVHRFVGKLTPYETDWLTGPSQTVITWVMENKRDEVSIFIDGKTITINKTSPFLSTAIG